MFGKLHVAPVVHAFLDAYPEVTVRLVLSDQVIDLVESHVDVAVRIGRLPDSDLVARQAGHVRWVICASADYLARRGEPASPEALTIMTALHSRGCRPIATGRSAAVGRARSRSGRDFPSTRPTPW